MQVLVGASELGQGMGVVLTQIAAEELDLPMEAVGITSADTAVTPYDRGSFSSRVTFYTGLAVQKAAGDAKNQLLEMASKIGEIPQGDLTVENQRVVSKKHPEFSLTFREIVERAHTMEKPILGRGWAGSKGDYPTTAAHKAQGKEYTPGWKYAAQAVEVELDEETGIIKVRKIASAHDVGKSLNPLMVKGQIIGGAVMGLGFALHERLQFEDGRVINPSFMDYKIPSAQEIPEIIPICVEVPLPEGPFGAKGRRRVVSRRRCPCHWQCDLRCKESADQGAAPLPRQGVGRYRKRRRLKTDLSQGRLLQAVTREIVRWPSTICGNSYLFSKPKKNCAG